MTIDTVAIVGVGLIGGSFGLALRAIGFTGRILGVSSPSALAAGYAVGAIDSDATLEQAAATADLLYLAQPVDRILSTLDQLQKLARPGTLITDAGSTKHAIVTKAAKCLTSAEFLGGHPLAGKEQRGAQIAEADLFRGRPYVLTPRAAETSLSRQFREWLTRMGAHIIDMSPEDHDQTVAFTSHLPQILSTALALTLSRQKNSQLAIVSGAGLRDMTRLALSSPDLWQSILTTNKQAIQSALDNYSRALADLQASLESDTLVQLFKAGAGWAEQFRT